MPNFRYQALDASGQLVAGELAAESVQQAFAEIEQGGLALQSISLATTSAAPSDLPPTGGRTTARPTSRGDVERAVLRSHMATILERGRTILPALEAYAQELPAGQQRRQLHTVCRVLARGDSAEATDSLAKLPEFWIPLLSSATTSSDPGHVLHEFLTESRRTDELRRSWWLTFAYPIVLLFLAAIVLIALSVFVIPEFAKIFNEFGLSMPVLTRLVVVMASWLSNWGWMVVVALFAALGALVLMLNRSMSTPRWAWLGDRLCPPFSRRTAIARFARFMADLLEAGVHLPDALRIAGFSVSRPRLQQAAWNLANDVENTGSSTRRTVPRQLTATVLLALTTDIPTEARIRLLRATSAVHAERVRIGLSWTNGVVEPIGICVVGIAVGLVVLALYLPLVKLIEGLTG